MAMDTNVKQLKNSKETHKVYLQMFIYTPLVALQTSKQYSNSSHVHDNCDSQMSAMACKICSQRDCVRSVAGTLCLSHIPIGRSLMEQGPEI
jgi:hypothetical protein